MVPAVESSRVGRDENRVRFGFPQAGSRVKSSQATTTTRYPRKNSRGFGIVRLSILGCFVALVISKSWQH